VPLCAAYFGIKSSILALKIS